MELQVKEWLPPSAFTEKILRAALSERVVQWAQRWIPGHRVEITCASQSGDEQQASGALRVIAPSTEAELSECGKLVLLSALLRMDVSIRTITEYDCRLLDAFAIEATKDFLTSLDSSNMSYIGEVSYIGEERTSVTLCVDGKPVGTIAMSTQSLIPVIKGLFIDDAESADEPTSRSQALKSVAVTTEGFLGRAELTLEEVKGLTAGDVIVLDRSLSRPVELRMLENGQAVAQGRLVHTNNQIAIQL